MSTANTLIRHQVLLHHAAPDRVSRDRLAELLLGRGGDARLIDEVLSELVSEGALERTGTGRAAKIGPGPRFEAVSARLREAVRPLSPEDLGGLLGQKSHRALQLAAPIGPIDAALFGVMEARRHEGALRPLPEEAAERVRLAEDWNDYIGTGVIRERLKNLMRSLARDAITAALDPEVRVIREDHLVRISDHLNRTLKAGTFLLDDELALPRYAAAHDSRTNEELSAGVEGWQLRLFTMRAEDDYEPRPFMEGESWPDVVHVELRTGGTLLLLNGRALNPIAKALHRAHVEEPDLPENFNGDTGAHAMSVTSLTRTGVMNVPLGDVFPHPVLDRAAGRVDLIPFGGVVDAETALQLELEGDEDFAAGYFVVVPEGVETIDSGLEWLSIADQDALVRFLVDQENMTDGDARALIETHASGPYPDMVRIEGMPESLHVYLPFGRNLDGFRRAMSGSGHPDLLGGGGAVLTMTGTPLDLSGYRVKAVPIHPAEPSPSDPEP